ncbi:hypothetical protein CDD83_3551 [Cordyceps sp. RAO-2017]|nr:hypothetical protein CDD83_3551 [Cordyceps sp. RAO-2017]
MSSMRNAVHRRPHRERAQPLERRRLGLLEKHKDYSLRAQDYNKKKAQLKALRQKAADRNEDEFYFGMMSRKGPGSRIKGGKGWSGTLQGDRGNQSMDVDMVRLLKTQDMGYVRTMRQVVSKEVARLEEQLALARALGQLDEDAGAKDSEDDSGDETGPRAGAPLAARKIVFADNEEERDEAMEEAAAADEAEHEPSADKHEEEEEQEREFERAKSLRRLKRQLDHARKKFKALTEAEQRLEVQRAKMAKTATSGGLTRKGHKIRVRTRKR